MENCSVAGCERPFYGKKFCRLHYIRNYRHGDPLKRLKTANGEGGLRPDGYKLITVGGKRLREHRVLWERAHGPIPSGYFLHHINENRTDNRLENLQLVTNAEHRRIHQTGKKRPAFSEEWKRHISEAGKRRNAKLPTSSCKAVGCERGNYGNGYCHLHYQRLKRGQPFPEKTELTLMVPVAH